jgi:hypothetical protein
MGSLPTWCALAVVCLLGVSGSGQFIYRVPPAEAGSLWTGTNRTAASCSQANVETQISASVDGDTIEVPDGTCSWSGMSITKAVHLKGISSPTITLTGNNSITKDSGGYVGVSGFAFSKTSGGNESYGWTLTGSWKSAEPIIFFDNTFTTSGSGLFKIDTPGGVIIAGNTFTAAWDDSNIKAKHTGDGQGSWISNSTMGTADTNGEWNIYVEGNTIYGGANQWIDCDDAARCVYRYNEASYSSFNSHGLDTSEDGVRHFEVYENQFWNDTAGGWTGGSGGSDISNQNWAIWIRGGTGVIFNNEIDDIANSFWGYGKSEAKFDIRAQQDNSGTSYGTVAPPTAKYSAGQGDYPRELQLGQSWDEALTNAVGINGGSGDYITDPIYVWGNTGDGASGGSFLDWANGGSWGSQTGFFVSERDYYFGSTAKPGYTAYTYPHPLLDNARAD